MGDNFTLNGKYSSSSYYWVDGKIYIEIDGIVIADINTPGGGFGKTIFLEAGSSVDIYMEFSPNGGSNNMHIGWTPPGGYWHPVPQKYLLPDP